MNITSGAMTISFFLYISCFCMWIYSVFNFLEIFKIVNVSNDNGLGLIEGDENYLLGITVSMFKADTSAVKLMDPKLIMEIYGHQYLSSP